MEILSLRRYDQPSNGVIIRKIINREGWQRYTTHKIAHAIAGCAAAAANKGKCQDGAIGAAVGEIVGEALVKNTDFSRMSATEIEKAKAKITA